MTVGLLSAKIVMSFKLMTIHLSLTRCNKRHIHVKNVFCAFIYMFIIIIFTEPKIRAPLYFIFFLFYLKHIKSMESMSISGVTSTCSNLKMIWRISALGICYNFS